MKDPVEAGAYSFVSYDGSRLPKDPKVRDLIRRRAMRHTAAIRKQNGGYGKQNCRQLPMWLSEPESKEENPNETITKRAFESTLAGVSNEHEKRPLVLARPKVMLTADTYQCTALLPHPGGSSISVTTQDYSLLKLANPLTVLHLGVNTLPYFSSNLGDIGKTLSKMPARGNRRSLLSFIPSRYGKCPSITHATDCVVARLKHIVRAGSIRSPEGDVAALKYYTKALRSLQEAIDDENLRMIPETLCAVQLLGLFELLIDRLVPLQKLLTGAPDMDKWFRHAGGAAQLIELRGPGRFQTDFELSLFMAHTGPIVNEAFLQGKKCFLEEKRWQQVIQAAVRNDPLVLREEAPLVIQLWACLGQGPNLFMDVEDLILSPTPIDVREHLIARLLGEQERLKQWLAMAEQHQYGPVPREWRGLTHGTVALLRSYKTDKASPAQTMTWRILQGTFFLCCLVKSRLLYALSPSRFSEMEDTCQALAHEVTSVVQNSASCEDEKLVIGLFTSEVAWMARAVIETKDIWSEGTREMHSEPDRGGSGLIAKWRFRAWCKALGRRPR